MNIAVIGLGKIGLPLAVQYAKKGKRVIGVDTNEETVNKVNKGTEPFPGEENLSVFLKEVTEKGLLSATRIYEEALDRAEVIVIAVPLLIDELKKPDFSTLDSVSQSIGLNIRKGTLVILETTVPIGTTRNRLSVDIEKYSSLKAGEDFMVAFSPERVFTGRIFNDLRRYPKLVGGINEESNIRAKKFYEGVLDFDDRLDLDRRNSVWVMHSAEAAEFSKLAETTYRDVNIALANQFAKHASNLNLDISEIIEAANSQSFSHIHNPGIWVGGHCIPVYPYLYLHTNPNDNLVRTSRVINEGMVEQYISILKSKIQTLKNKEVLILGVSYRSNVKETYNSGAFIIKDKLESAGANVTFYDPKFSDQELLSLELMPYKSGKRIDVIVLQTNDSEYLDACQKDFPYVKFILDGRNVIDKSKWNNAEVIRL